MVQALEILKQYITCEDAATRNKFFNLLDSFWHKNDGHILKSHTISETGDITFTFLKEDGSTFNVSLPALPNSKPISFITGLQAALNDLVSKVPGKGLSTNDLTTELLNKLNALQNYQHPDLHTIAEVDGLPEALEGKQPIAPEGWGFSQENYSLAEKQKLGKLAILHYAAPTTDLATLAAIPMGEREDGQRRFVHSEKQDYFYDSTAIEGDIAPADQINGTGFWKRSEDKQLRNDVNEHEVRIGKLEGLELIADMANQKILVKNSDGALISELSVAWLNNEGTVFSYNEVTEKLELKNDAGELLAEVPVSAFVSNLAKSVSLSGSTFQLKDTQGTVISSVVFQISNIQGLASELTDLKDRVNTLENNVVSLVTKRIDITVEGANQVFDLDTDFFQIQHVVSRVPLLTDEWDGIAPNQIKIIPLLEVGDVIEVQYWKSSTPANAVTYSKGEVDTKDTTVLNAAKAHTNAEIIKGVYGIEWDVTAAAPEVTRIGDMEAHKTLPFHSQWKRCLVDDEGEINYFLHPNGGALREDGTPATLDGSHGQVMTRIPGSWWKFEEEANTRRAYVSLTPFKGAHFVPEFFVGSFKAALDRPNDMLASVINTSVDFRGGGNQDTWDAQPNSQLGKPVTVQSRGSFRTKAKNRGAGWFDAEYQYRKIMLWSMWIEFGQRNMQSAVNNTLTAEGYRQGGLGTGPTDLSGGDWSTFSGYYPLFDCGLTLSLGNKSGEVPVTLQDFPTEGLTKQTQVNCYRGIENPFGDLWEWTSGVNVKNQAGLSTAYVANGKKSSENDYLGYKKIGMLPVSSGYTSDIMMGPEGDILPKSSGGGSSTTYFSDYYWQNVGSEELKGLLFGGSAYYGSNAGPAAVYANTSPAYTTAHICSRLCFFPGKR